MTTPTQSDEQRVKEVWPDATSYVFDGGCCILPKPSVAYFERISGWFDVESSAWHDAASRLPKATTDHEFVWRADSEQCSVCGENHHGCIIVKQPSVSPMDEGEAAPKTFEEWWNANTDNCEYDPTPEEEGFARAAWNAAKASSPATVPRDIAHTLWNEGGRLRTELAASLGMHPENWHKEGLQQRIAEWDKAAERYFDYALAVTAVSP